MAFIGQQPLSGVFKSLDTITPDGNTSYSLLYNSAPLWIEKTKEIAHSLLTPTDWYELRKLTKAIDIPVNVVAYIDAVIQASNDIETAINNSNNLQEFMALFESVNGASPTIHNWPEGLQ